MRWDGGGEDEREAFVNAGDAARAQEVAGGGQGARVSEAAMRLDDVEWMKEGVDEEGRNPTRDERVYTVWNKMVHSGIVYKAR